MAHNESNQNVKIVNTLDEGAWRQFVDQHPQGNIFHTPEMFQVFARTPGYQSGLWAAVNDRGQVLALFTPVLVTLKGGLLRYLTTRAIAYGSVLCSLETEGPTALAALLKAYSKATKYRVLFTELRNLSDMAFVQPVLNTYRFAYQDHLDYLIDLDRPVEEIMQGIGARTRKNIRRGLRRGEVVIEEITTREQIPLCYGLLRQTYAAAHVPLADSSLFEAAFDVLFPKGMIRFTLVRVGDAYVGTSVELLYRDVVYGWYGGVDREYSRYNPNECLMWHILEWSAGKGYRKYDFGGAGRPDEEYGVRDFKAKFGGELVCFGRNTYVPLPWLYRLSTWGYSLYRRVM